MEVCVCGVELCQRHASFHGMRNHHRYPIRVAERVGDMITHMSVADTSECKKLLDLIKNKLLVSAIVQPKSRNKEIHAAFQACMHQMEVIEHLLTEKSEAKRKVFMGSAVCCICAEVRNRWLCLACGLVFCGGKRHDKKGKGHARRHFDQQMHCVFLDLDEVKCAHADPECIDCKVFGLFTFCSFCSGFVSSYLTKYMLGVRYVLLSGCELCGGTAGRGGSGIGQHERCPGCTFDPEESKKEISRCGVAKKGNTGYFSSLLLAISFLILNTDPKSMALHEVSPYMPGLKKVSVELSPITVDETDAPCRESWCTPTCFGCAFSWTMHLMFGIHEGDDKVVDLTTFWEIMYGQLGIYGSNDQRDIFKFFRHLMAQIKIYDASQHFDSVSNLFHFCIRSKILCEKCHERWDKTEKCFIVYLKPQQSIREYFSIKQLDSFCKCGAKKKTVQSAMSSIPEILTFKTKKMENPLLGSTGELGAEREIDVPYTSFAAKEGAPSHGFVKYSLRAAIIYQENGPSGGHYFVQFLDAPRSHTEETEEDNLQISTFVFGKHVMIGEENQVWRTISDDKLFFSPLFGAEATMLFYLRTDSERNRGTRRRKGKESRGSA